MNLKPIEEVTFLADPTLTYINSNGELVLDYRVRGTGKGACIVARSKPSLLCWKTHFDKDAGAWVGSEIPMNRPAADVPDWLHLALRPDTKVEDEDEDDYTPDIY